MSTAPKSMTAEELLALGDVGRSELINGELVRMSPSGFQHGAVAMTIGSLIAQHVRDRHLGVVTAAETGFRIARDPDTVRAPDAAFISAARLGAVPFRGFFEGAPDLAVEVVSPEDRWSEVSAKAQAWLTAGCKLVWVIDPATTSVTVYEPNGVSRVLRRGGHLEGADVLPGFKVSISEVFDVLPS